MKYLQTNLKVACQQTGGWERFLFPKSKLECMREGVTEGENNRKISVSKH